MRSMAPRLCGNRRVVLHNLCRYRDSHRHPNALPCICAVAAPRSLFPLSALGILFFTAWPEEFLFRGILQNLLSRTMKNEWAGLAATSVIFGFSHIFHAPYPNWKYVLLATIAGLFYGHAWMKRARWSPARSSTLSWTSPGISCFARRRAVAPRVT